MLVNNEKHYITLNNYYKNKYKQKVYKIPLDGNFSCPNFDGKVAYNGCTFCNYNKKQNPLIPLQEQWQKNIAIFNKKWGKGLYIPYFQANTNTYGSLAKLKSLFYEAINLDPNIVMISIATRPDEISNEILDLLITLNQQIPVQIELGLQTIHENTAKAFNRCYSLETFSNTVALLRKNQIEVVVHIINGLKGETKEMMLETIRYLNKKDIQGIKIHMLHLVKGSVLGAQYLKEPWPLLSLEEYVDITTSQIAILKKNIVIHRLTGDPLESELLAPKWPLKKFVVINEIDKLLRKKQLYQGDLYEDHDY